MLAPRHQLFAASSWIGCWNWVSTKLWCSNMFTLRRFGMYTKEMTTMVARGEAARRAGEGGEAEAEAKAEEGRAAAAAMKVGTSSALSSPQVTSQLYLPR